MNVIIDTSVWSLVLRRKNVEETHPFVRCFRQHVEKGDNVCLIGIILQELLDGISAGDLDRLVGSLIPFSFLSLTRETYIEAAKLRNTCRTKGITASSADFLVAAACIAYGYPLLTSDGDYKHIAKYSSLQLISL